MSHAARSERPISRWISIVRPLCLPLAASRPTRSGDEPGSIEYSAVTQPVPRPFIQRGTSSSIDAVHSTRVLPNETRQRPVGHLGEVALERASGAVRRRLGRQVVSCGSPVLSVVFVGEGQRSVRASSGPSSRPPSSRNRSMSPLDRKRCWPVPPSASQETELCEPVTNGERGLVGRTDERHAGAHHVVDRCGPGTDSACSRAAGASIPTSTDRCEQPLGEHRDLVAGRSGRARRTRRNPGRLPRRARPARPFVRRRRRTRPTRRCRRCRSRRRGP